MPNEAMRLLSKSHDPLRLNDPLPFACRGCGHLCCGNLATPIHVMPPEYLRIQWHLERNPLLRKQFNHKQLFIYDPEHVSGLPIMKLALNEYLLADKTSYTCPFLVRNGGSEDAPIVQCAIHPARPHTCRVFPIGMLMDGWYGRKPGKTSYHIMSYCPGFETPGDGEITIEGYSPPSLNHTLLTWLNGQLDNQLFEEITFHFFEVITYYYDKGWHLPTGENAGGRLTEQAYNELAGVFYELPNLAPEPDQYHDVIMQRLSFLRDEAETIIQEAMYRSNLSFLSDMKT